MSERSGTSARGLQCGFTLLELAIVTSLLAVLALTVSPIFSRALADTRAEHGVADLVAAMKYAQSRAISDTAEYRVYVDLRANTYWLAHAVDPAVRPQQFERPTDRYTDVITLPPRLRFADVRAHHDASANAYYVSFFPSGATDVASVTLAADTPDQPRFSIKATGAMVEREDR